MKELTSPIQHFWPAFGRSLNSGGWACGPEGVSPGDLQHWPAGRTAAGPAVRTARPMAAAAIMRALGMIILLVRSSVQRPADAEGQAVIVLGRRLPARLAVVIVHEPERDVET